jgi:hypothetical protein
MRLPPDLEAKFPGLVSGYTKTSDYDPHYNCIAHAAGESDVWWEPVQGRYWPSRIRRDYSIEALQAAFQTRGYAVCASGDLESNMEKVALFMDAAGEYSHAARQLVDGSWTSKIGKNEDISHDLRQLEGDEYGRIVAYMSRPRTGPSRGT